MCTHTDPDSRGEGTGEKWGESTVATGRGTGKNRIPITRTRGKVFVLTVSAHMVQQNRKVTASTASEPEIRNPKSVYKVTACGAPCLSDG